MWLDIVIAGPQGRRPAGDNAELLFDVDLTARTLPRTHVFQAVAFDHADEFPAIEPGVIRAHGRRDVPGFPLVADDAELIHPVARRSKSPYLAHVLSRPR